MDKLPSSESPLSKWARRHQSTIVAIAGIAAFIIYLEWQGQKEKRELQADECLHAMIYKAAIHNGYSIAEEEVQVGFKSGRLQVSSFASQPIDIDNLDDDISNYPGYLIRCTIIEDGALTLYAVQKYSKDNQWVFLDPEYQAEIDAAN